MTEFDSAFLCGLLEKFRPKKILELGVASGGTTGIILNCLENIGKKYEMFSVDISERYYIDPQYKTGFLTDSIKKNLKIGTHKFYLGTTLPFVIDEIGDDIDFLILDTIHTLPGENLDFLVTFPYLKSDAVVCLHDVKHNQTANIHGHATVSLFAAVTAMKFLNLIEKDDALFEYPNIAAFQINDDTIKNIENVFLTLILRWRHLPEKKDLNGYIEILKQLYPTELFMIFIQALIMNSENLKKEWSAAPQ